MKLTIAILSFLVITAVQAQQKDMSFFITSVGPGKGADLGGLKGADAHCQALAKAAGAGNRQWRAYLSTDKENARDRIGKGPWRNAKGQEIAKDLDDLHKNPRIDKQTGLDEKGQMVNGRGDSPNRHDILTGSTPEGRAITDKDMTCGNWTKSGEGAAMSGARGMRIESGSATVSCRCAQAAAAYSGSARPVMSRREPSCASSVAIAASSAAADKRGLSIGGI